MPNWTGYLNIGIWEKFKHESNKSGLVSELLAQHYGIPSEAQRNVAYRMLASDEGSKAIVARALENAATTFCPEGHRLTDGGRCITKGCKYAK